MKAINVRSTINTYECLLTVANFANVAGIEPGLEGVDSVLSIRDGLLKIGNAVVDIRSRARKRLDQSLNEADNIGVLARSTHTAGTALEGTSIRNGDENDQESNEDSEARHGLVAKETKTTKLSLGVTSLTIYIGPILMGR